MVFDPTIGPTGIGGGGGGNPYAAMVDNVAGEVSKIIDDYIKKMNEAIKMGDIGAAQERLQALLNDKQFLQKLQELTQMQSMFSSVSGRVQSRLEDINKKLAAAEAAAQGLP